MYECTEIVKGIVSKYYISRQWLQLLSVYFEVIEADQYTESVIFHHFI